MSGRKIARAGPSRPQRFILVAALLIVVAFGVSFVLGLRPGSKTLEPAPPPAPPLVVHDARARVEVMNGAGKPGLAKLATERLRNAGFDVVQFGNAGTISPTSSVIDRVGNRSAAVSVGQALDITTVKTAIDTARYVDATVIVGKDWPPQKATAAKKTWQDRLLRR